MKIEHIIDDIKGDVLQLAKQLGEQLQEKYPGLKFSITTPGLDELTAIKTIALSIEDETSSHCFPVSIHTQNGHRVFENAAKVTVSGSTVNCTTRHPLQDVFIIMLREIIKRKKQPKKTAHKPSKLYSTRG